MYGLRNAEYLAQIFGPMLRAKTPKEQYYATLRVIEHGFVTFKTKAVEIARANDIDTNDLPLAIKEGEKNLLLSYATLIAQGHELAVRKNAEKLATKFGVDLDQLVEDMMISSVPI